MISATSTRRSTRALSPTPKLTTPKASGCSRPEATESATQSPTATASAVLQVRTSSLTPPPTNYKPLFNTTIQTPAQPSSWSQTPSSKSTTRASTARKTTRKQADIPSPARPISQTSPSQSAITMLSSPVSISTMRRSPKEVMSASAESRVTPASRSRSLGISS